MVVAWDLKLDFSTLKRSFKLLDLAFSSSKRSSNLCFCWRNCASKSADWSWCSHFVGQGPETVEGKFFLTQSKKECPPCWSADQRFPLDFRLRGKIWPIRARFNQLAEISRELEQSTQYSAAYNLHGWLIGSFGRIPLSWHVLLNLVFCSLFIYFRFELFFFASPWPTILFPGWLKYTFDGHPSLVCISRHHRFLRCIGTFHWFFCDVSCIKKVSRLVQEITDIHSWGLVS